MTEKHYISDGWLHPQDPGYPYDEVLPEEPHVHEHLDRYGYCKSCGVRVLTHFKGWPLPDKPNP